MHKIIIDCDTGTDDAIALVAALNSPDIDLRAITTVSGNVDLCYTCLLYTSGGQRSGWRSAGHTHRFSLRTSK